MKKLFLLFTVVAFLTSCQKDRIKTRDITFDPINEKSDTCYAFLPNAFTPNADYTNDAIRPITKGVKTSGYEFVIRKASKKKIFTSTQQGEYWDGADCPTGIYIGTVKGEFETGTSFEASNFIYLYTDCVSHRNVQELEFESMFSPVTGTSVFPSGENICP